MVLSIDFIYIMCIDLVFNKISHYLFYSSIHNILNEKSDFPNFLKIEVSNRNPNNFGMLNYDNENDDNENDKEEDISILKNTNEISINNEESR